MDHGLLDIANSVEDMKIKVTRNEGEEEEDEETVTEESVADFSRRVNMYVALSMRMHPERSRDQYKDEMVYQARKNLIAEFLAATALKKCRNNDCQA